MRIDILTLFPEMFAPLNDSILKRARDKGTLEINIVNIRDFSKDKHLKCDDAPFGGGAGMIMTPQPVCDCIRSVDPAHEAKRIYLSPRGKLLTASAASEYALQSRLLLLCGHYEGIDERVLEEIVTDYVSAGDYVLTGGELPAMMIVDAVSRLIPGVLHNDVSAEFESFQDNLLEYPQYSRPEIWHDRQVPPILLSGHHANVEKWRREQSVIRTAKWRPDLLEDAELTMKERELAEEIIENREKDLKNEE